MIKTKRETQGDQFHMVSAWSLRNQFTLSEQRQSEQTGSSDWTGSTIKHHRDRSLCGVWMCELLYLACTHWCVSIFTLKRLYLYGKKLANCSEWSVIHLIPTKQTSSGQQNELANWWHASCTLDRLWWEVNTLQPHAADVFLSCL